MDSKQIEEKRKKILEIRYKQHHVNIDGVWRESKRVRNADDGTPCIVCGWYIDESYLFCHYDKRCKTLGKKMNMCMGRNVENERKDLGGIHLIEKNDWRYDKHYSYECTVCGKLLQKEKMPQSVIDVRYPPTLKPRITQKIHSRISTSIKLTREVVGRELRHQVFVKDRYKCRECGISKNESPLEVDHIKPVSKGGLTILSNLQLLCFPCNRAKHAREWEGGSLDDSEL